VLTDSLTNRRESFSGVSLDEEMTNLLKFQRGFQACSRALNAMDDAVDLLISRTGRVGL
jgi:flagellar hook-associated protein 1 FlgK